MDFADMLRAYRVLLDLTQDEIADAFGIDRATYNAYESDKIPPPTDFINDVAECLMFDKNYFTQETQSPGIVDLVSLQAPERSTQPTDSLQVFDSNHRIDENRWSTYDYDYSDNSLMLADSGSHINKKIRDLYKDYRDTSTQQREKLSPEEREEYDRRMAELRRLRLEHEAKVAMKEADFAMSHHHFDRRHVDSVMSSAPTPFTHDEIRLLVKYRLLKKKYGRENKQLTIDDFLMSFLNPNK